MSNQQKAQQEATPGHQNAILEVEDQGYQKLLSARQISMMAIGGSIGTGLFLGAGGRLEQAGPSLAISYIVCGVFAFFVVRALGELVLHRATSGSFVSYAREFFGEKMAFVSGWFYWLAWAMSVVLDITAVAIYMNFFGKYVEWIGAVPQWVWALSALVLVVVLNFISVRLFGELEFWFSLIKVAALVSFLLIGVYFVIFGTPVEGHEVGFSMIIDNGGMFPNGLLPALLLMQGVVFSFSGVELIGTAAGETKNPEKIMPRAINAVIFRLALFYVGSVVLLSMLLPHTQYSADESPFVTFFGSIGVEGIDTIMNLVVLTAVLSSLNSGLYATGRMLRSMAMAGSAPAFAKRLSRNGIPYGGVIITAGTGLLGIPLNYLVPAQAFEAALSVAAVGTVVAWATIIICQLKMKRWADQGRLQRPSFRLFGAPYTGYATLLFLAVVLTTLYISSPITLLVTAIVSAALIAYWFVARKSIALLATAPADFTGLDPMVSSAYSSKDMN